MKRLIAVIIVLALTVAPCAAFAKEISSSMFSAAKSALNYISYGEYSKALKKLGLTADKDAAKKLRKNVEENLSSALYGEVQTDVAVCYSSDSGYRLAVPVEDPSGAGVEAFVATSKDGESFNGYKLMEWNDVMDEVSESDDVTWNKSVKKARTVIVSD